MKQSFLCAMGLALALSLSACVSAPPVPSCCNGQMTCCHDGKGCCCCAGNLQEGQGCKPRR